MNKSTLTLTAVAMFAMAFSFASCASSKKTVSPNEEPDQTKEIMNTIESTTKNIPTE